MSVVQLPKALIANAKRKQLTCNKTRTKQKLAALRYEYKYSVQNIEINGPE